MDVGGEAGVDAGTTAAAPAVIGEMTDSTISTVMVSGTFEAPATTAALTASSISESTPALVIALLARLVGFATICAPAVGVMVDAGDAAEA